MVKKKNTFHTNMSHLTVSTHFLPGEKKKENPPMRLNGGAQVHSMRRFQFGGAWAQRASTYDTRWRRSLPRSNIHSESSSAEGKTAAAFFLFGCRYIEVH